ncbi:MAG: bifunctional nuclease family protein [Anaerolineales bacterium]|nr:bifunctional nuclease family protein [Anaerolineales bacterium]
MVEVTIDSIRVSLMSQHRIIILKELTSERFLPIWIGPYEAEAITVSLQEMEVARPLTHDLLRNIILTLGGEVQRVVIMDLRDDVFYARITVKLGDRVVEIDSRPSDAIALAVRVHVPVFVDEAVMDKAASIPEQALEDGEMPQSIEDNGDERLEIFKDFVDKLDFDDLEDSSAPSDEDLNN